VYETDHAEAAAIARAAGELLLELRAGIGSRFDADEAKRLGDRRSHEYVSGRLAELYPDDGLLSEEGADDHRRLATARTWIVDPLDGTREFGEPPRVDWAVHVALVVGERPVVGAVALPAQGVVLSTATPPAPSPAPGGRPRLVVSRTRPPPWVGAVGERLDAEMVPMGSAGAKIAAVITGEADIYLHDGGQYEWDSAAPVAVALAAGLHASRLDGSSLRYNQADPWLPDLAVCHPSISAQVLVAVSELRSLP
jgi:3'(2'), 5'-bisphosphate nucleotidase